jgi:hypothetical protein
MLGRIQSEYRGQGVTVVAINIQPYYALEEWKAFWTQTKGAGDVLWASDTNEKAIKDYRLVALGTEIIVDRQGQIVFRSDGPAGHEKLRSKIESALRGF